MPGAAGAAARPSNEEKRLLPLPLPLACALGRHTQQEAAVAGPLLRQRAGIERAARAFAGGAAPCGLPLPRQDGEAELVLRAEAGAAIALLPVLHRTAAARLFPASRPMNTWSMGAHLHMCPSETPTLPTAIP